ncbi:hypothetical protein T484DRAFT_2185727 [Baffinella frigidus]|nr:hypothetical protein T484DRAFT_2185727 [Cryptophyta sp. CCMP2293]
MEQEMDLREDEEGQDQQDAVERLMDMGFSEDEILIALENCHHNFEAAAAWLLGDHGQGGEDDGGPEEAGSAGLLQNVMSEAQLQQALANPRVVAALQQIIQSPEAAAQHLHDPEVGSILEAMGISAANREEQRDMRDAGLDPGQPE